jgi:2-oxoglutarate ferredoxin oxidoreductase subunit alpha
MIEGNATAQFSHLINRQTGFTIQDKILKYSGLQFSVEEIVEQLEQLL